ncbi:MAG: chromate transporter [Betaproteobacteria bacterium]|nr:chromate transporter [Betaproteobacteria bacterium]NBY34033.1 chromate transporter [Betaproteobacteria bacterium]
MAQPLGKLNITNAPRSRTDLFLSFTWLGLQGFGGVLAVVQREMVDRKQWMTLSEFAEEWALAQTIPGPNVVNLSVMFGGKHFGPTGALAAMSGLLLLPGLLMVSIVFAFQAFAHLPVVASALHGMGVAAAGMVMAAGWRFWPTLKQHPLGWLLALLLMVTSFGLAAVVHWPLAKVIGVVGLVSCGLTWWRLQAKARS